MFGGSLFTSPMFREMEDDPFFANHRAHMNHFNDLFVPHHQMLMPPDSGGQLQRRGQRQQVPFGMPDMFGGLFRNMDSMFSQMQSSMENMRNDPNAHSFTSSTVMSYSNTGNGAPTMYQASSQTRSAPGGIKETRRMERDSMSGVDRMSLGHHINDRAHVIERSRARGGNIEEKQDYINLDEDEADAFNAEWQQRTSHAGRELDHRNRTHRTQAALPDSRAGHRSDHRQHRAKRERQPRRD